jgi:filamentous hemagglutinin family protein
MSTGKGAVTSSINRLAQAATVAVALGTAASGPVHADVDPTSWSAGVTIEHLPGSDVWTIHAPDGSVINYSSFDIFQGQLVRFIQGNPNFRVLNRVESLDPSIINGTLRADGIVYLVNPAGVIFNGSAVIDTAGIIAAAGHITDNDFVNGVDRFDLTGDVTVQHGARVKGTDIHLLGQRVANHGLLKSDGGIITMLAGDAVYMFEHGGRLIVEVDGSQLTDLDRPLGGGADPSMLATPAVENTGRIINHGGRIILGAGDMASLAFRNTGVIKAAGGEIDVVAAGGLVQNDGLISATSRTGRGGDITVQGPSVLNRGRIEADSHTRRAGTVEVTSQHHTFLTAGSEISAAGRSGSAKGGEVLVHSYGGLTVLADGALIDVSGGRRGGRGGFAEVSGDSLTLNGHVNLKARRGFRRGELLLDPVNIFINETGGDDSFLDDGIIEFGEGTGDAYIAASTLEALQGLIHLQATRSIFVLAELDLGNNNDMLWEAYRSIFVDAAIMNANDFTMIADADMDGVGHVVITEPVMMTGDADLRAGGEVFLFAPLDIGGDLRVTAMNTYFQVEESPAVRTGGTQTYDSDVQIAADLTLESGGRITALGDVSARSMHPDGQPRVTIDAPFVVFHGLIGLETDPSKQIKSIDIMGASLFHNALVVTREFQKYRGPVAMLGDALLVSINGGQIRFYDTIDGPHTLAILTSGLTRFQGPVGSISPLASLITDATGETLLGADMNAGTLDLRDAVRLSAGVRLTGTDSVIFGSTIDGAGHDLTVDSPLTTFGGDATGLGLLATDAAGRTIMDDVTIQAQAIDLGDNVDVGGDVFLRGAEFVAVGGTMDGDARVTVESSGYASFGDDVGATTALRRLDVAVSNESSDENLIVFGGDTVHATGTIRLNAAGRGAPSTVATIAGTGDLTIESENGRVVMGQNEKLTAVGDLTIRAADQVVLGDLNAAGDLFVDAPDIKMHSRPAGRFLLSSGSSAFDGGIDIVAGGLIVFTSSPTVLGTNLAPVFVTPSGQGISGNLTSFEVRRLAGLDVTDFFLGGTILDLGFPVGTSDVAEALANASDQIAVPTDLDPFALRDMESMGIYMREMNAAELLSSVDGRSMYNDIPTSTVERDVRPLITTSRLRRATVLRVIDRYSGLFLEETVDPETGETTVDNRAEEIQVALGQAWDACTTEHGPDVDGAVFRSYVDESTEHLAARDYLDDLQGLVREIWTMGTTPYELQVSLDRLLGPICPDPMNQSHLEQAIGADRIG